jgi:hypothetical protein
MGEMTAGRDMFSDEKGSDDIRHCLFFFGRDSANHGFYA